MCRNRREPNYYICFGLLLNSFCYLCRELIPHFIILALYVVAIIIMVLGLIKERKHRDCL